MKIAFFGVGNMGSPMAANLIRSGKFDVSIFDLDKTKAEDLICLGAQWINDINGTIAEADVILSSLPGPVQIKVLGENSIFPHAKAGATWIDLSTNNLASGQALLADATEHGLHFLDAPVSGGDEGARAGTLSIYVGGDKSAFEKHQSIFDVIGGNTKHLGKSGAGYAAKISQVVLCYLHSIALSEAMMLGVKAGVDATEMLSIIQNSTGSSYVADRYGPPILNGDYDPSFALGLALKDMHLAMELADTLGITLPMSGLVTNIYAEAVERYGAEANHLIAVKLLEDASGTLLRS
jgi:3-hydroxyisobutyrate dehydrogenase-like beta-hydroxyacid dehydrogenase